MKSHSMVYTCTREDHSFDYEIKKYRQSKVIRILLRRGGRVLITGPKRLPLRIFHTHIEKKFDWIITQLAQQSSVLPTDIHIHDREHFLEHKEAALMLVKKKVLAWNSYYGFEHGKIGVRQVVSRWGSCSTKKNLNFNYKILFLPEDLQDYIVVHELCHLEEMNHSAAFWKLVEKTIPNHRLLRKRLKK